MSVAFSSFFHRWSKLSARSRTLLTILGLSSVVLLLSWVSQKPVLREMPVTRDRQSVATHNAQEIDTELKTEWEGMKHLPKTTPPVPASGAGPVAYRGSDTVGFETPPIAHAAELSVGTKEFTKSRVTLEEILERHHGYAAKLRMVGQPSASMLTASLRVPSSEFNGAVDDLKRLGNVEREEQTADEITEQRADLEARLTNAQSTLARLQGILAKDAKHTNSSATERQLAAVNDEIARLEAERAAALHRVTFAQVLLSMHEELVTPAESFGAQFRSAALAGLTDLAGSLSAIALFAVSRGPLVVLWVALIYFPARWAWRKWQAPARPGQSGLAEGV
jgi:hypothetical protein